MHDDCVFCLLFKCDGLILLQLSLGFSVSEKFRTIKKLVFWGAASQFMSMMQRTGAHWKHGLLGLLFSLNEFGVGYCLYICEDISPLLAKKKNYKDDKADGGKTFLL